MDADLDTSEREPLERRQETGLAGRRSRQPAAEPRAKRSSKLRTVDDDVT